MSCQEDREGADPWMGDPAGLAAKADTGKGYMEFRKRSLGGGSVASGLNHPVPSRHARGPSMGISGTQEAGPRAC